MGAVSEFRRRREELGGISQFRRCGEEEREFRNLGRGLTGGRVSARLGQVLAKKSEGAHAPRLQEECRNLERRSKGTSSLVITSEFQPHYRRFEEMSTNRKYVLSVLLCLISLLVLFGFASAQIEGFSKSTNKSLSDFLERHEKDKLRKVAVFDFDGTLMGQVPYYAADELFISQSEERFLKSQSWPQIEGIEYSTDVIENYRIVDNIGHALALLWRVQTYKGHEIRVARQKALDFYTNHYKGKIFKQMKQLVKLFQDNGFEVWVVTGTIEFYVDRFIPENYGIHPCRVIGVKTIIHDGLITDKPAGPVTEKEGKVDAIETIIKEKPLFVAGNSIGDLYMLRASKDLSMVINPSPELKKFALRNGWVIENIEDKPLRESTYHYKKYGIKGN